MMSVFEVVSTNLVALLKGYDQFPTSGKCGFYPEKVNLTGAILSGGTPSSNLHRQLFGEGCEKKDEAAYLAGRSYGERKLIEVQVAASEEMLRVSQGKATEEEVLRAAKRRTKRPTWRGA